nr:immunoglobulin light chain junction region [Macaca mulatta]
CGQGTKLPYTF